jgi:hypothetical protein
MVFSPDMQGHENAGHRMAVSPPSLPCFKLGLRVFGIAINVMSSPLYHFSDK